MQSKVLVRSSPLLASRSRDLKGHLLTFHAPSKDIDAYTETVAKLRSKLSAIPHRFVVRLDGVRSPKFKWKLPTNVQVFDHPSLRGDEYTVPESDTTLLVGWNPIDSATVAADTNSQMSLTESVAIRILGLLRQNANVSEIAAQVKLDPGIQFNIVRYLNAIDVGYAYSGGFKNFEHSIMFMGYKFFTRWMSTYLMYSRLETVAPAVYQLAVTRGRLMESLAHLVEIKAEDWDSLYITGVFSLLDRVFGRPIAEVLSGFDQNDIIVRTLLGDSTPFAPLLNYVVLNDRTNDQNLWRHVQAQGWCHGDITTSLIDAIDYAQRVDPRGRDQGALI